MSRPLFISCEIWREANNVHIILQDISQRIDEKNYSILQYADNIESIAIVVKCHPNKHLIDGWGKPRKYINYKKQYADVRLPIPYNDFINADYDTQYLMVVDNIIQSLRVIDDKCKRSKKAKFDSESIIEDLLKKLEISYDSLENIVGVLSDEDYKKIVNG